MVPYVTCGLGLLFMMEIGLAADRITLHHEFSAVEYTLKHDHLDSRLRASESEQFSLSQKVIELQRQGKDVDPLNTERLNELNLMHAHLIQQMLDLERGHSGDDT